MRVLNGSAPVTGGAKSKAKAKGEGAAAGTGGTETVIATWSAGREPLVARTEQLLEELKASGTPHFRSEEHTSELQSLMRISYAVFCLKKNKTTMYNTSTTSTSNSIKLQTQE